MDERHWEMKTETEMAGSLYRCFQLDGAEGPEEVSG